ncbi:MAG: glutamate--cysteine ligase [Isosphaeraceae bacterium]
MAEVERDLSQRIRTAAHAAAQHGILLAWGGTHPFSHWREQEVVSTPRYLELAEKFRETLCRQVTFGLHVHVGVEDGELAIRVCNGINAYLPALLALSANSPFWCGRATGLQSHRVEVMSASPTGGLFPRIESWSDYEALAHRLTALGIIKTTKELWWDVRPSPEHGTVEVRICDMPADLHSVLGLTALIQCLVASLSKVENGNGPMDECGMMITRQNRWLAARYGLDAQLVNPHTGVTEAARDVLKGLVVQFRDQAEALGCSRQLDHVWTLSDAPTGAERQITVFEQTRDLVSVARHQANVLNPVWNEARPSFAVDPTSNVNALASQWKQSPVKRSGREVASVR